MDLRQLKAVVVVADAGTVTKAAELLHVVQSAVTRQIRALEEELGEPLFERTRQGMSLTPAGEVMVEHARRILRQLDLAQAEVRLRSGEIGGTVTVGLLESLVDAVLEPLVERIRSRYPAVSLRVVTAYSGYLQQWLDVGDVDLSLLYDLTDTEPAVVPLLKEQLWAVAPPAAALRADEPISWDVALQNPLVLPVAGHGLRILIERGWTSAALAPDIAIETNSMYMQKRLVMAGRAWTFLPAIGIAADVAAGRLSASPLVNPPVFRSVVLAFQRRVRTPASVRAVAQELISVVETLHAADQ